MSLAIYDDRSAHPSAPDVGEITRYFYNGEPYYMREDGVPRLFGSWTWTNFSEISRDDTVSNSTSGYVTYLTLTRPNCEVGRHRVGMSMVWNLNNRDHNFIGALYIDGVEQQIFEVEPQDSGADIRYYESGFMYYDIATAGTSVIELKFKPEDHHNDAKVYHGSIEAWRVA